MMPAYQIKDWDKHFENHESRKVKGVRWIALPNKHDGKSYRRLSQLPGASEIFAAWTLILQVASKMPTRGILADEDGPLDSDDLSAMTGFPAEIFDKAFKALIEPKIGWLEMSPEVSREKPVSAVTTAESPGISRHFPESPAATGKTAATGKGTEGKRKTNTPDGGGLSPAGGNVVTFSADAHARLMAVLQDRTGPIGDGGAQGKAVKWLLQHEYAEAECVACLDSLLAEEWRKSRVSWLTVKSEIGTWRTRRDKVPKDTTDSNAAMKKYLEDNGLELRG
jgi:hypothetical protein